MKSFVAVVTFLLLLSSSGFAQLDLVKRGASITVKVDSFSDSQKAVSDLAAKYKGGVADRSAHSSEKGQKSGWMRVRIPKGALDTFLTDVRSLGKVFGENLTYTDFTQDYLNLGSRSNRLREHSQRLQGLLGNRRLRGSDVLYVQERILRTSVDEDTLLQQREAMPKDAAVSSVIVTLFEPALVQDLPHTPMGHVREAFVSAGRGVAETLLGLLSPVANFLLWLIMATIVWLIFRKPIKRGYAKLKENFDTPKTTNPIIPLKGESASTTNPEQ